MLTNKNGIPSSRSTFYDDIKRTKDLINITKGYRLNPVISDFVIDPNRVKLHKSVGEILNLINKELRSFSKAKLPGQNDIIGTKLEELITQFKTLDKKADGLKHKLQTEKHTGVLILATKKINSSKLQPIDRELLSREGILMYLFSRAVFGLGVTDMDGIVSSVMSSLDKVTAYLNRLLVEEVINDQNLGASQAEMNLIKDQIENASLSYDTKSVNSTVLTLFKKAVTGGGILDEINEFLDSGMVQVPEGMDRNTIIDNMVEFLISIGYKGVVEEPPVPPSIPKDNLQIIKGIGPKRESLLNDNDIRTYGQLAALELATIQLIIDDVSDDELNAYIYGAMLISDGKFEEFLELQNMDGSNITVDRDSE